MLYKILGENKKEDFLLEIFKNRGFGKNEDIIHYLNTSDEDIEDFYDLDNITEAVEMLKRHIDRQSRVLIVVDCDVDGFTSSAILYNFLKEVSPSLEVHFVLHEGKQHGLSQDLYENVYEKEYNLIFLPDGGTNDYKQHQKLKEKGTDIIILDHHNAPSYSKDAITVNNQLSQRYKNKNLSGAGIVWHFIEAYVKINNLDINVDKYLDLVALGNISDIMDLRSIETKHLVMKGLSNITNPFFKTAIAAQEYSLKGKVTPEGVAWYIGPYINAMVRVGKKEEKEILFTSLLEENGDKYVPSSKRGSKKGDLEKFTEQAFRLCANTRNKQNKIVDEGMAYIKNKIEKEHLDENKVLIVTIPEGVIIPEIVGLVANKIASEYQQPTLILREFDDSYTGSGRNFNYSPLEDFRGFLKQSRLSELAEGHASAFGFSIKKEKLEELKEYCNDNLKDYTFSPTPLVDFEFDLDDNKDKKSLTDCLKTISSLNELGFWGQGIKEPLIVIKNINIQKVYIYEKKTTTGKIVDNNNFQFMCFKTNREDMEVLEPKGFKSSYINCIGRVNKNEFLGRITYQVFVERYEKIDYNNNIKNWNF